VLSLSTVDEEGITQLRNRAVAAKVGKPVTRESLAQVSVSSTVRLSVSYSGDNTFETGEED